eukprot:COSAG02_NODE_38943_length_423_cov_0.561728_1_plen_81_part_10
MQLLDEMAAAVLVVLALAACSTALGQQLPAGWGSGEIDGKTYYYHNDDPGTILWDPPAVPDTAAPASDKKELFTLNINIKG